MAFDFPASPTVGAIYSPAGGPSWQWNGTTWIQVIGTTIPPVPLTAESRNRICNPAMQISQELGDTATGTTGAYLCDQWLFQYVGPTISAAHVSTVVTPGGALTSLNFNIATAKPSLAAGDYFQIIQPIEGTRLVDFGWGTAAARQAVLRFTVICGVAGTYAASIRNAAGNRSWVGVFTIAAGEINTYVTRTLVIPGDTTGTWPKTSAVGAYLAICFASGTTYIGVAGWQAGFFLGVAGMANAASITGPHIQLADVGLYLDRNNTGLPPPWQMPDEAQELAACQRYYEKATSWFNGNVTNTAVYYAMAWIKVPKRTAASLSGVNISNAAFPATVGTLSIGADYAQEGRTANVTGNTGVFASTVTFNARM